MFRAIPSDTRGVAAVEFALCASMLALGLLNAVDVGYYGYKRMEVESAAQVGAQVAWKTCNSSSLLPATQNCAGLSSAITTAIQSTSLGTAINLASGSPTEGYYCVNSANKLQLVGSLSSKPATCSTAGNPSAAPGDYIQVEVIYNYTSLFPGITVISALGIRSISKMSWMRLG
jgi:Flp pilus assembly protein TadG